MLLAFAGAMTGLVTSDDLIGLYVFWELTTVFSYCWWATTRGSRPTAAPR